MPIKTGENILYTSVVAVIIIMAREDLSNTTITTLRESADSCTATTTFGDNLYQSLSEPNTSSEYMKIPEASAEIKYEAVKPPARKRNLPPLLPRPLSQLTPDSSPPLQPLHKESEAEESSSQQKLPIRNYYKLALVFVCVIFAFFVLLSLVSLAFVMSNMRDIKMSNALINNLTVEIKYLERKLQAQLGIHVDSLSSEINFLKNTTSTLEGDYNDLYLKHASDLNSISTQLNANSTSLSLRATNLENNYSSIQEQLNANSTSLSLRATDLEAKYVELNSTQNILLQTAFLVSVIVADLAGLKSNLGNVNLYSGCITNERRSTVRERTIDWYTITTLSLSIAVSVSQIECTHIHAHPCICAR